MWQAWSHWIFALLLRARSSYHPPFGRWYSEHLNSLPKVTEITSDNILPPWLWTTLLDLLSCTQSTRWVFGGVLWPGRGVLASTFLLFAVYFQGLSRVRQRSRIATYLLTERSRETPFKTLKSQGHLTRDLEISGPAPAGNFFLHFFLTLRWAFNAIG